MNNAELSDSGSDSSGTPDIQAWVSGSESFELSSQDEIEDICEIPSEDYGGQGEPELVREVRYLAGDILHFCFGGTFYTGEVESTDNYYI